MATKLFHLKKKSVSFLKFYKIVWSPPLFIIWSNLQPNASIQGCSLTAAHQWPSRLIGTGSPNQHWYWWAYRMLSLNRSLQPAGPAVHSFKSPPFLVAQVNRQITIDSTWCYQLNTSSFIPSHKVSWQRLMAPDSNDKARQINETPSKWMTIFWEIPIEFQLLSRDARPHTFETNLVNVLIWLRADELFMDGHQPWENVTFHLIFNLNFPFKQTI